jgi:hypothetical protein
VPDSVPHASSTLKQPPGGGQSRSHASANVPNSSRPHLWDSLWSASGWTRRAYSPWATTIRKIGILAIGCLRAGGHAGP